MEDTKWTFDSQAARTEEEPLLREIEQELMANISGYGEYNYTPKALGLIADLADMRVARGAKRLDEGIERDGVPGNWKEQILNIIDALDLQSTFSCVVGITFSSQWNETAKPFPSPYEMGLVHLRLTEAGEAHLCGFEGAEYVDYGDLEEAWRRYLEKVL